MCVQESRLVAGVAFKKTFSYAGFEMQRKRFEKPKIAMLNVELELKSEKENAELRIDNVEVCVPLSPLALLTPPSLLLIPLSLPRSTRKWWMQSGPSSTTS